MFSKDKSELPEVAFSIPGCDIFQETLPSILSWDILSQTMEACALGQHGMYVWGARDSSMYVPLIENFQ